MTAIENMDIVVVVKPARENEELRYAIRSWAENVPHRNIVLAGYKPQWLRGVKHVHTKQRATKWQNSTNNLIQACHQKWISDDFILMNDDFFAMRQLGEIPTYHRGSIDHHARQCAKIAPRARYIKGMRLTKRLLERWKIPNLVSYELHVPMVINKRKFIDVIRKQRAAMNIEVVHKRTLYGNYYSVGGNQIEDVKIVDLGHHDFESYDYFISTLDISFHAGEVGRFLRRKFSTKSRYEL